VRLARTARALRVRELWTDGPLLPRQDAPLRTIALLHILLARHAVGISPARLVDAITTFWNLSSR